MNEKVKTGAAENTNSSDKQHYKCDRCHCDLVVLALAASLLASASSQAITKKEADLMVGG